jgi:iron complex outermembrane receptor protein
VAVRRALHPGHGCAGAARDFSDLFRPCGVNRSFATRYSGSSPKLGLRFAASARTTLFGNLSDSREPPSFSELAGGPGITQVDQQRGRTLKLGLCHRSDTLQIDAAACRTPLRDALLALNDAAGNPQGTINAERTLHQGLEFGLAWQLVDALRFDAIYLYDDFRFQNNAVYGNKDLAGVPPMRLARSRFDHTPQPTLYVCLRSLIFRRACGALGLSVCSARWR